MGTIETRTHTALHVLKGAAVKVLGARWTAGVHVKGNHGRLTLQFDRKPTPGEVARIVNACNKQHTPTTAQIGRLTITKTRHRATKKLLEISYDIQ